MTQRPPDTQLNSESHETKASADKGIRAAQAGILINTVLVVVKLIAGVVGNSYALIADSIESCTDIFSSLVLMGGLIVARREPTSEYPFGYGRAESLAGATIGLMLIGAAIGIAIQAVREILTPHHLPAAWTLVILLVVVIVKWAASRRVHSVGNDIDSNSVRADAWHHFSDAITSAAAFIGISIAVWGGPGWEPADDWAALACTSVIVYNGISILRTALRDLMDASPENDIVEQVRAIAKAVPDVLAIEKTLVRRSGLVYHVAIHVQAAPTTSLSRSHAIGGQVKSELRQKLPQIASVDVHMEPFGEG